MAKMKRSQSAPCVPCRYRKVRCDRRSGTCTNCERLNFNCSYQQGPSRAQGDDKNIRSGPPERRRASQACIACRRQKARCSGELPACKACRQRQRLCQYAASDLPVGADSAISSLFPIRRQELLSAIDRFFGHLYPVPAFAFLHEPSVRKQCESGVLDPSLALSLAAVTNAYLSSNKQVLEECASWIRAVEMEIWDRLHSPSIHQAQSLLLMAHYHIQTGHFGRAYMLVGMTARSTTALRLNYERPELDFVAQETRRRLVWSLTSIDSYFSVGLPEHETISYANIYQRLPCSEEEFREGIAQPTAVQDNGQAKTNPVNNPNPLAAFIEVGKIMRDVMRLTRQLAISDAPLLELPGLVQNIQNDLWRLHADLELDAHFAISETISPQEMKGSRWFLRYLLASLCWHQVHCDLYRIFLPGYSEAVSKIILDMTDAVFREHAVDMCHIHVRKIHIILAGVLQHIDVPILSLYVAICAYQAARLSLFLPSLPGPRAQIAAQNAVSDATTALCVLQKFFSDTVFAQDIIADLQDLIESSALSESGPYQYGQLAVHSLIKQANFVDDGYEA
ncbi:uncharacterized protein N7473_005616 [Penicillium subrubescens]|nr:uncharacterized protein N7473_005616 [Penicillium subrubescens]KAJ5896217.1 hypothetical protein N7473_005616 [Penicillium subrubescens]